MSISVSTAAAAGLGRSIEVAAVAEGLRVLDDPVVLPARSLGIERPDLALRGVAAGLLVLDRVHQTGGLDQRHGRPVTVSIGVATFPDDAKAEFELIRVADQRLYEAKRTGRNLVCSS